MQFLRGLPWWLRRYRICLQCRRPRFDPLVGMIPWRREWLPTPVFLPGGSHRQRSLAGYSPWGHKELDTTEQWTLLFSHFEMMLFETMYPGVTLQSERTDFVYLAKQGPRLRVTGLFARKKERMQRFSSLTTFLTSPLSIWSVAMCPICPGSVWVVRKPNEPCAQ